MMTTNPQDLEPSEREISLEALQEAALAVRRKLRKKGMYPGRKRTRPRTEEKERALLKMRVAWIKKYGVKMNEDGEYVIQSMMISEDG